VWENEPQPHLNKLPVIVKLSAPASIRELGVDYIYYREDPDNALNVIPTLTGVREFLVVVKVIGRSQTANKSSRYYAEILRSSLRKPSVLEHFRANEIAIVRPENIANFDAPWDSRVEPISAFNLIFSCALALVEDESTGTIGSVKISSTLKGEDGAALPSPPNLDDLSIPPA
jgi:hypothetical protein